MLFILIPYSKGGVQVLDQKEHKGQRNETGKLVKVIESCSFNKYKQQSHVSMQLMFTKLSENSSRSLRNTDTDLRIPRFTTSYGQRSFSYRGVTVWNKLSTEIKNAPSLAIFKNLLKQALKNQRV